MPSARMPTKPVPRDRSSAAPLACLYVALIVYASLYPFSGWRVPGISAFAFLTLPWPRWWTWFDLVSNLFGYVPLGALAFGARVRVGVRSAPALATSVGGAALLSLAMELLQNFLPQRVASNVDLGLNATGAALGATLGFAVHRRGWVDLWQTARDRWFIRHSAGGLALLLLWPFGLLFPTPLPFAVGQVFAQVQETVAAWVDATPAAAWLDGLLEPEAFDAALSPVGELAVMALGLLAPCLIAFTISRPGWRRLVLSAGAAALGAATTTLSTALNFGPQHALAWNTPHALASMGAALAIAAALSLAPRRAAVGLALMALTALVVLVGGAPADLYFADSLQAWEQGRFIRFHGAARWVGWLWPYAAIGYLLARLVGRDEALRAARGDRQISSPDGARPATRDETRPAARS